MIILFSVFVEITFDEDNIYFTYITVNFYFWTCLFDWRFNFLRRWTGLFFRRIISFFNFFFNCFGFFFNFFFFFFYFFFWLFDFFFSIFYFFFWCFDFLFFFLECFFKFFFLLLVLSVNNITCSTSWTGTYQFQKIIFADLFNP